MAVPDHVSSDKGCRSYGVFDSNSAASLFDAAFSKPVQRRGPKTELVTPTVEGKDILPNVAESSQASKPHYPHQVFSPSISLPESSSSAEATNDDNFEESGDEEIACSRQSSQNSITNSMIRTCLDSSQPCKKRGQMTSTYDFDEVDSSPTSKKRKDESKKEVVPKRKPVYRHKWNAAEDEEEGEERLKEEVQFSDESNKTPPNSDSKVVPRQRGPAIYTREGRVRNVKEPHQILESGEYDDFKDDLDYMVTSLNGIGGANIKCLSCTSLARKCINPQFRHFIRSQNKVKGLMHSLADSPTEYKFALSSASVLYFLCRDSVCVPMDTVSTRIFSQLLKMENAPQNDIEVDSHIDGIWDMFSLYIARMEASGRKITFEYTKESLSPSSLVLEALVFVMTNSKEIQLKNDLLNLGILQWAVEKVEKIVVDLPNANDEMACRLTVILERCFRILENSMMYHKKNQAFLISHRGSTLIHSCSRLLSLTHSRVSHNCPSSLVRSLLNSLVLMARVLTNLSHENELCCAKLGQLPSFLSQCLSSFTFLVQKFAPEEKFDMTLLMSSLIVNLVERCNANRKKVIETRVTMYNVCNGEESEETSLVALTKMFVFHENAARQMDEGMEKELMFEEPCEVADEDEEQIGRLDREKIGEMNESEMLDALKGIMNKASSHMEDSVMASHIALLVGCVLQQNEESARSVKSVMPDRSLSLMGEQLHKYVEFLKIAGATASQFRSMERILEFMERIG